MKNLLKKERKSKKFLIRELSGKVAYLKEENANLVVALEALRRREREVLDTLSYAKNLSAKKEAEVKTEFAAEERKLADYRERWQNYAGLLDKSGMLYFEVDRTLKVLDGLKEEFDRIMPKPESPEDAEYQAEKARLKGLSVKLKSAEALSDADITAMLQKICRA